jgi:hypothetical protein
VPDELQRAFARGLRRGGDPSLPPTRPDALPPTPERLIVRFTEGLRRGRGQAKPEAPGAARTTGPSSWLATVCPGCLHTFRVGDQVWLTRVGDRLEARHDEPALPCQSITASGATDMPSSYKPYTSQTVARFHAAVNRTDARVSSYGVFELSP